MGGLTGENSQQNLTKGVGGLTEQKRHAYKNTGSFEIIEISKRIFVNRRQKLHIHSDKETAERN